MSLRRTKVGQVPHRGGSRSGLQGALSRRRDRVSAVVPHARQEKDSGLHRTADCSRKWQLNHTRSPYRYEVLICLWFAESSHCAALLHEPRPYQPLKRLQRVKVAMADPQERGLPWHFVPHPSARTCPNPASLALRSPRYRFPVNDQQRYGILPMSPTVRMLCDRVNQRLSTHGAFFFACS